MDIMRRITAPYVLLVITHIPALRIAPHAMLDITPTYLVPPLAPPVLMVSNLIYIKYN